eukprot:GILI01039662.1.p1 GENE.GILI01039662.1~~GILI01039662.1.p1  ORF type:complete len:268 (+),score=31.08 GILI01039662.1:89-805(+)
MGEEVTCKRLRTEGPTLRPLQGSASTCSNFWTMPHHYARKLVTREEIPQLIKTLSKATTEGIATTLTNLKAPTAATTASSVLTVAQLMSVFPHLSCATLVMQLAKAPATHRWYLRTGVALTLIEVPLLSLVERASEAASYALRAGIEYVAAAGSKLQGDITQLAKGAGAVSGYPSATVHATSNPALITEGAHSFSVISISVAHNYFFILHGHGVADTIPLPKNILKKFEADALESGRM